jgi:hypothetical protein
MQKLCASLIFLQVVGCGSSPRPHNVPEGAIRIPGPKGADFWQHCSFDSSRARTNCRIFNAAGAVLREGVFIPYTGNAPNSQSDLNILPKGGNEWVELSSGTILIPESDFARVKRFLDWQRGLAERP